MEQRREPDDAKALARALARHVLDDGDRVREHVFVTVDRILLEAHRRQLRKELVAQPRVDEQPHPRARMVDDDELVELVADSLRGDDLEPAAQLADRVDERVVGCEPVAGDEARGAQHAQRVVGERLRR